MKTRLISVLITICAVPAFVPLSFADDPSIQLARIRGLSEVELSGLRERAVQGDPQAQAMLGLAYYSGNRQVKSDETEARRWFEMAAKHGNLDARFWLIGMEDKLQQTNAAVIRSRYLELAECGHAGAMNAYALFCEEGKGGNKDLSAAMLWWKKAAETRSAEGAFNVGIMYLEGEGVPANDDEAVAWLRCAADEGSVSAASRLGTLALMQKARLSPGPESTRWLRQAAEAGDAPSMLNLGMALFHGLGTATDLTEAYMWFTLAAQRGMIDGRGGLRPRLTSAQLAEAERRVADWNARHSP